MNMESITKNSVLVQNWAQEGSLAAQIFLGIFLVLVIYVIFSVISFIAGNLINSYLSSPKIFDGIKSASTSFKLSQNPKDNNSRLLRRSSNQKNGIEFTYMTWIFIDGWESQSKKWKHIFHKGPVYDEPLNDMTPPHKFCEIQAPGMWLFPDTNKIRVYMNTFSSTKEYVDIENIPIGKWFNIALVLSHRSLDVYVNGFLIERMELNAVPKQNYYDLHVTRNGGFQGYLSDIRYFNYAVRMTQLNALVSKGPNFRETNLLGSANRRHYPYLSNRFWFDSFE